MIIDLQLWFEENFNRVLNAMEKWKFASVKHEVFDKFNNRLIKNSSSNESSKSFVTKLNETHSSLNSFSKTTKVSKSSKRATSLIIANIGHSSRVLVHGGSVPKSTVFSYQASDDNVWLVLAYIQHALIEIQCKRAPGQFKTSTLIGSTAGTTRHTSSRGGFLKTQISFCLRF